MNDKDGYWPDTYISARGLHGFPMFPSTEREGDITCISIINLGSPGFSRSIPQYYIVQVCLGHK